MIVCSRCGACMRDDAGLAEARRRRALHKEAGDYRPPIGSDKVCGLVADLKGVRGEEAFGEMFGLPIRTDLEKPGGDGGIDFYLPLRFNDERVVFTVDAKAASKPKWLVNPVEGNSATLPDRIYVLTHYIDAEDRAVRLGWHWGAMLMRHDPRDLGGRIVHWLERGRCRSLAELKDRQVP